MKKLFLSLLIPVLAVPAFSENAFQTEAMMAKEGGDNFQAWILAATETRIRYKTSSASTVFTDAKISDFTAIFLKEPTVYTEAMDLYEARKYKVAQAKFAEVKDYYAPISKFKDNYHTLSAFYEMECMRKQGDLEGLTKALQGFIKTPLSRDHQLRQLDLYIMWDAVRSLSWDRVWTIASERDEEVLPGSQRAQIAYCKGLALQNLKRSAEAIISYNVAITADAGGSEQIAQDAALNALRTYLADEEIQTAIAVWGTDDENKSSGGYTRLTEAAALAKFYEKYIMVDKPLPADLKVFLKYGV
ncbi:MAG: hypothetical protein IZT59_03980 [Verrucomicrobia bacterium]|jgi:tetratricopeptide (TPR) repeat protein|nr:hypothetical protein [Verrucomicrobiota bacterium]|tara:strand:+ start:25776 stop:26681 length:906 start_codon:yes stop_codon:yes gene_type:complete